MSTHNAKAAKKSTNKLDNQVFEKIVIKRFNKVFHTNYKAITTVISHYQTLNARQQTLVFSEKKGDTWYHVVDKMIGKRSFQFISYSKKHFKEVTIPRNTKKQWTKELLNEYKRHITEDIRQYL